MTQNSPVSLARAAGLFYLLNIVTIFLAIYLFRGIAVPGDGVATAGNIMAHIGRYRAAFAAQVISTAASIAMAALLYRLLRPVDAGVSLMAALFRVLACALAAVGYVLQLAPLVIAGREYAGLDPAQRQALIQIFAGFQVHARNVSIAFFGCGFLALAYLVARSGFLPRLLAGLLFLGGVAALVFAASPVPQAMILYLAPVGLIAELSFALWLTIKGVDAVRPT